ncbi:unnamed protein product, partial [Durusdinium trenchii]
NDARNPDGRHVIFVPWRDLARQTAAELARFQIKSCIVGDGFTAVDPYANVVVCVYASAHHLRGHNFRIKIVDEAHHLEMKHSSGYTGIIKHRISSELAAHFTATFYLPQNIDFRYDLDKAIQEGHVCDFMITVPVGDTHNMESMGRFILENRKRLTPVLVALNRVQRAKKFAEVLCKFGLSAKAIDGGLNHTVRHGIKKDLQSGKLDAVSVVNIFNEGTSISELKSVVFMDKRQSAINVKQLAMRVTRLHNTKPFANVVLPLCDRSFDRDVRNIIRFHFVPLRTGQNSSADGMDWANVSTELFDRFGRYLGGGRGMKVFDQRVQQLANFMEEHDHLPARRAHHQDERMLASYILYCRKQFRANALSNAQILQLREIPQMAELMETWNDEVPDRIDTFAKRCMMLKEWEAIHHRLPKGQHGSQEEKFLVHVLHEVGRAFRAEKLTEDQVRQLEEIPSMPQKLEKWKRLMMKKAARAKWTWSEGCNALREWLKSHGNRKPRRAGELHEYALWEWLSAARKRFIKGRLGEEEIRELEQVPTMMLELLQWEARWGPEERWQQHAQDLEASAEEQRLAMWLRIAKYKHKKGTLSTSMEETLTSIPELSSLLESPRSKPADPMLGALTAYQLMAASIKFATTEPSRRSLVPSPYAVWRRNYFALKAWQALHGALPQASGGAQAKTLANWLAKAKQLYKQGKLSRDQIQDLLKIPGAFERLNKTKPPTFEDVITRIQLWISLFGRLPQARNRSEDPTEKYLTNWLGKAMNRHLDGKLSPKQSTSLQQLHGVMDQLEEIRKRRTSWEVHYKRVRQWLVDRNVDLLANWRDFSEEEPELAAWVAYQRQRFLRRPWLLSEEQVELLKALPGFQTSFEKWNQSKEFGLFQQRCDLVQCWADKHGGQLPSESHVDDLISAEGVLDPAGLFSDDQNEWHMNFLSWVNQTVDMINFRKCTQSQRYTLRKYPCFANLMPKPQVRAEEPSRWWRRFRQLKRWISVSDRIPRSSTDSRMEQKLGWWVADARQLYSKGALDQDRLSHLWTLPPVVTSFTRVVLSWDDHFSSLQAWLMTHNGRLPKRSGDEDERQLAVWLQNDCAKARKDELHPGRLAKLKEVAGLGPRLRGGESLRLHLVWKGHYASLVEWLEAHSGKLPCGSSGAAKERLMAFWLHNNLAKAQDGDLASEKQELLQEALGLSNLDWSGESGCRLLQDWFSIHLHNHTDDTVYKCILGRREHMEREAGKSAAHQESNPATSELRRVRMPVPWGTSFRRLEAWCEKHGRLPHVGAKAWSERTLAIWLKNAVQATRWGNVDQERLAKLSRLPGVSDRLVTRAQKSLSKS